MTFEAWLERLRTERGYSPHTIANYRRDLRLLCWLAAGPGLDAPPGLDAGATPPGSAGPTEPTEAVWARQTEGDVRRWVAQLSRNGDGPRTIARRLSAWRGWFDYLARAGPISSNPVRLVRAPRRPRRLPKALGVDQATELLDGRTAVESMPRPASGADGSFNAARDQAIIELLYSSGLRLSELTSLDERPRQAVRDGYRSVSWFDRDAAEVIVLGKGGKTRSVPVGRQAMSALAIWLAERAGRLATLPPGHPGHDEPALFITGAGKRLSNRTVQYRLRRLAQQRGVAARVHPHVLRHSFASHLLQSSGDLRAVQELLGHESIATTQVYTALDFQRLAAVYDSAHPRARRRAAATPDDQAVDESKG